MENTKIIELFKFIGHDLKEAYTKNMIEGIKEKNKGKQKKADRIDLIRCELDDLMFFKFDDILPKESVHFFY